MGSDPQTVETPHDPLELDRAARAVDRLGQPDDGLGAIRLGLGMLVFDPRPRQAGRVELSVGPFDQKLIGIIGPRQVQREAGRAVGAGAKLPGLVKVGVLLADFATLGIRSGPPQDLFERPHERLGVGSIRGGRIVVGWIVRGRLVGVAWTAQEPVAKGPFLCRIYPVNDRIDAGVAGNRQLQGQVGHRPAVTAIDRHDHALVAAAAHVEGHVAQAERAGGDHRRVTGLDREQVVSLTQPFDDHVPLLRLLDVVLRERQMGLRPGPLGLHPREFLRGDFFGLGLVVETIEAKTQRAVEGGEELQLGTLAVDPLLPRPIEDQLVAGGHQVPPSDVLQHFVELAGAEMSQMCDVLLNVEVVGRLLHNEQFLVLRKRHLQ